MSKDWQRRSEQHQRHDSPPVTQRRVAPGKVTRTAALSGMHAGSLQRKARPGSAPPMPPMPPMSSVLAQRKSGAADTRSDGPVEDWMLAAVRPDLHQAPILRQRSDVGYAHADAPRPGAGNRMPGAVQARMEQSFGADFSDVRIHQGPQAAAAGALAYTQGNDIHFAPGQYQPDSQRGQELLGHELAHVVQQRAGRVRATAQASGLAVNDDPALEREADQQGARAARGESVATGQASAAAARQPGGAIQRKVTFDGSWHYMIEAFGLVPWLTGVNKMMALINQRFATLQGLVKQIREKNPKGEHHKRLVALEKYLATYDGREIDYALGLRLYDDEDKIGQVGRIDEAEELLEQVEAQSDDSDAESSEALVDARENVPGSGSGNGALLETGENEPKKLPEREEPGIERQEPGIKRQEPGIKRLSRPVHDDTSSRLQIPDELITSRDNLIGGRVHFTLLGVALCHYEVHGFTLARPLNQQFQPRATEFRDYLQEIAQNGVVDEATVRQTAIAMIMDGQIDEAIGMLAIYAGERPAEENEDFEENKEPEKLEEPEENEKRDIEDSRDGQALLKEARGDLGRELNRRQARYDSLMRRARSFPKLGKAPTLLEKQWRWLGEACGELSGIHVRTRELGRFDQRMDELDSTLKPLEKEEQEKERIRIESENRRKKEERKQELSEVEKQKYSITRDQAQQFIKAHPPESGVTGGRHYIQSVPTDDLDRMGFEYRVADYELFTEILENLVSEQKRIIEERKQRFQRNDPSTWDKIPELRFVGVSEDEVRGTVGGAAILDDIRQCTHRGNGPAKGTRIPVESGVRFHTHLVQGSWGLAFIYVQEEDGRVRPVVYDIARGRTGGNQYPWERGNKDYNSDASYGSSSK